MADERKKSAAGRNQSKTRKTSASDASRIPIFRGPSNADTIPYEGSAPGDGIGEVPVPLTAAQLGSIVESLIPTPHPGDTFVRLSPSSPRVTGRGALVFVRADIVEGGNDYAEFKSEIDAETSAPEPTPRGHAVLWLYSPVGWKYLVDLSVSGKYWHLKYWAGPVFEVAGPGGAHSFKYLDHYDQQGYHLTFGFEAEETGWHGFSIYTVPPAEESAATHWKLHSCEVTYR